MNLNYVKQTPVRLKDHHQFDENWLKERILEDPTILGLGDVEVKDVERIQPKAGRLDLLLRNPETGKRYEVEITRKGDKIVVRLRISYHLLS